MKLIFLLEEPSMKYLLDALLPRILPEGMPFQTIPHSGKRDLERSIPRKLRGWREPDVRFVVVHDQDNKDCIELKSHLVGLCRGAGQSVLVRIACQELESWYFGDVEALAQAYGNEKVAAISRQSKYRIPDRIPNPKEELCRLLPEHQQINGAKRVAPFMEPGRNTSVSFQFFVEGVRRFAAEACK